MGSDYIVIDPKNISGELSKIDIRAIFNRHFGVGSDGILCRPNESDSCDFSQKIYNPDGVKLKKLVMAFGFFLGTSVITLSGSIARGDYTEQSDIEIACFCSDPPVTAGPEALKNNKEVTS